MKISDQRSATDLKDELERVSEENRRLRKQEIMARTYIREKTNHLLQVMGTAPLDSEELDSVDMFALDPIGIAGDAFAQVLEHLKTTNEELAQARDEIQAIFDSAGAAILVVDDQMRLQAFNRKSREVFFPEEEQILGRDFRKIICGPEPTERCIFDRVMEDRWMVEETDFAVGHRVFHVVGQPIKDKNDQIKQVILVYTEVTARKKAEQALRESESRYKDLFENSNDLVQSVTPEGHFLYVNRAWRETLGYSREELTDMTLMDIIDPRCFNFCMTKFQNIMAGEKVDRIETNFITKGGRMLTVEGSVNCHFVDGHPDATWGIFRDITARKEAEKTLRESEERFRLLYEHAPLSYQSLDESGNLIEVNTAALEMLGYCREEMIGRWFGDFLTSESRIEFQKGFPKLKALGEVMGMEATIICKDGSQIIVSINSKVAYDNVGNFKQSHCILHNVTERKEAERKIQQLAYYDPLTELPNRALLQDRLAQALAQAGRDGREMAVLFLDLDRFKGINDTLGHVLGDALLQQVASRLRGTLRRTDTVARLGGDEFVIILPHVETISEVTGVVQKILEVLAAPVDLEGHELFTTASIGIALYPVDGQDADTLLKNADTAMYRAKEQGRNTYQFYTADMNAQALERLLLGNDLRRALERGEFFLTYQPQIDVATEKILAVEALLRWRHPDLGLIPPERFIPLAEETGLILPLGRWVLKTACQDNRAWQKEGLEPVVVAVNLSGCQFKQPNLAAVVEEILQETELPGRYLEFEITESILMETGVSTQKLLRELKLMGVHLVIDDFGTGYSSLSYLKHFPIDKLKIDRSFVRDIIEDADDAAISEAIIALAKSLKIRVVAEGVENREQVDFLRRRNCVEMQGHYFSLPVTAEEMPAVLRNEQICIEPPIRSVGGAKG